jgi:hypothetical protein
VVPAEEGNQGISMMKWLSIAGLIAIAFWFLKKIGPGRDNDLRVYYREQEELQNQGSISTAVGAAARNKFPLTTIGDTPLAGIHIDPFNFRSPTGRPKPIVLNQTDPNSEGSSTMESFLGRRGPDYIA